MTELQRKQILDTLQNGWGTYVNRFQRLPPAEQTEFLVRQGYARFADILAHIIAWWEEGKLAIETLLEDPSFISPDYDVDAFNAREVEKFRALSEKAVIRSFELMRASQLDLASRLPDEAFQNQKIVNRFRIEVIGHLREHDI